MTLEKASELVNAMRIAYPSPDRKAADLFQHFAGILSFRHAGDVEMFARMCGYDTERRPAGD